MSIPLSERQQVNFLLRATANTSSSSISQTPLQVALSTQVPYHQYASWTPARRRAWDNRYTTPDTYFQSYLHPHHLPRSHRKWTLPDHAAFLDALRTAPPQNGQWGIFSLNLPTYTGAQCRRYYRALLRARIITPIHQHHRMHSNTSDAFTQLVCRARLSTAPIPIISKNPVFLRRTVRKFLLNKSHSRTPCRRPRTSSSMSVRCRVRVSHHLSHTCPPSRNQPRTSRTNISCLDISDIPQVSDTCTTSSTTRVNDSTCSPQPAPVCKPIFQINHTSPPSPCTTEDEDTNDEGNGDNSYSSIRSNCVPSSPTYVTGDDFYKMPHLDTQPKKPSNQVIEHVHACLNMDRNTDLSFASDIAEYSPLQKRRSGRISAPSEVERASKRFRMKEDNKESVPLLHVYETEDRSAAKDFKALKRQRCKYLPLDMHQEKDEEEETMHNSSEYTTIRKRVEQLQLMLRMFVETVDKAGERLGHKRERILLQQDLDRSLHRAEQREQKTRGQKRTDNEEASDEHKCLLHVVEVMTEVIDGYVKTVGEMQNRQRMEVEAVTSIAAVM